MKKRIVFCAIAIAFLFSQSPAALASSGQITVLLDGRQLAFDVPPQTVNGRTLVPMRTILTQLGADVDWDAATQTVTATKGGTVVRLRIGSSFPTVNGSVMRIDQPGIIVDGRTLVPLRFVSEALGVKVDWIELANTVSIDTTQSGGGASPFPGKIAFVTKDYGHYDEEFRSVGELVAKYGADKIVHMVRRINYDRDYEYMIEDLQKIAADPDIKAVIINKAVIGTNAAVDKLLEVRPDILVAYCSPSEDVSEVAERAHLSVSVDEWTRGERIVMQAKDMGAKVFIHYSFPRHMSVPTISMRRDDMKEACEREGVLFVELTAPDPTDDVGIPGAQQFVLEDVPRQVAKYGKDTAFFATECVMQLPLQIKVVDERAIYPEPCCPSPYHWFPSALGIDDRVDDEKTPYTDYPYFYLDIDYPFYVPNFGSLIPASEIIPETRKVIASKGASGRLATWPVSMSRMFTVVCAEYAIKWINGETYLDRGVVDYELFEKLCEAYVYENLGESPDIDISPLSIAGSVYNNYLVVSMDSIIF